MIPLVLTNSNNKHHLHFHPPLTSFLPRLLGHLPFQTLSVQLLEWDGSQRLLGLLQRNMVLASESLSVHHGQATAGNGDFSTPFGAACPTRGGQS